MVHVVEQLTVVGGGIATIMRYMAVNSLVVSRSAGRSSRHDLRHGRPFSLCLIVHAFSIIGAGRRVPLAPGNRDERQHR
jgi:hypothetical protein